MHLSPRDEYIRHCEISDVIDSQSDYAQGIICGDFNELSNADPYDLKSFNPKLRAQFTYRNRVRSDVLAKVDSAKYVDAALWCIQNEPTFPTPASEYADTKLRIDYICVSPILANCIQRVSVIQNETTNAASDHYPVVATIAKPLE